MAEDRESPNGMVEHLGQTLGPPRGQVTLDAAQRRTQLEIAHSLREIKIATWIIVAILLVILWKLA